MDIPFIPGPPPLGEYEFLVVAPEPTRFGKDAAYKMPPSPQIEGDLWSRSVPAERKDVVDGRRVYRVAVRYLNRCAYDKRGAFIGYPPAPRWRFLLEDPTLGVAAIRDWAPIGDGRWGTL